MHRQHGRKRRCWRTHKCSCSLALQVCWWRHVCTQSRCCTCVTLHMCTRAVIVMLVWLQAHGMRCGRPSPESMHSTELLAAGLFQTILASCKDHARVMWLASFVAVRIPLHREVGQTALLILILLRISSAVH
jgi:hypothetical protein